ncbi:BsaWI family type II restriction enzyme [Rhodoflexus sp.]
MLETNQKVFKDVEGRYYFDPIKKNFEKKVKEVGAEKAISYLTEIMQSSTAEVEKIIQKRIKSGEINDASQTRKAVAGNGFQGLVAYALIFLQSEGLINKDLVITLKPKKHKLIEDYATIQVGDDVQKPDVDLMIYHNKKLEKAPVLIFSIKTSLRERAGQTYKWKLLMDIATSKDCMQIKQKYGLSFEVKADFRVGFITTNFYDEITQPQQIGMLNFFDFVYLTKSGKFKSPINEFSKIVSDLKTLYK